ncbi:hypothetical protein GF337_17125 [candidate division KSB1 bacterium]|nr:hypothetical protein [candidate division KSB1 bacterium]
MVQNVIMEQVKVPAQVSYLRVLRKFISRIGEKYNFTPNELYAFKASVDEACTNIIEHGYGHKDGSITMKAIVKSESFTIELVDKGKSFDPSLVAKPNLQSYVAEGKKGGLGIFIMHKLLDKVDYQISSNGNILRLTKFRQPVPQQIPTREVCTLANKLRKFFS